MSAYPSKARCRFRDGRAGGVRYAADIPAGIAGNQGKFSAFALGADIPGLLLRGAVEAVGGQLDSPRDSSGFLEQRAAIPLRMNRMGHYILSVADFGEDASRRVRGTAASVSFFVIIKKAPDLSNGGLHLPYTEYGLRHLNPRLRSQPVRRPMDSSLTDPKKIVVKLHLHRGHASAQQQTRVLADSDKGNMQLIACADEVCQAFDKAPRAPVAGTSTVAVFNEKLQVDLPFWDDAVAAHLMDVFSKYSLLMPVHAKNPREVWDASRCSWVGGFGPPMCIMGKWGWGMGGCIKGGTPIGAMK